MTVSDICIYFIIAILSVAYPFSQQGVGRLDERYSSISIMRRFRAEREWLLLQWLMGLALAATLAHIIWTINFKPFPDDHVIYFGWTDIILIVTAFPLVACFLLYTRKLMIYYVPLNLFQYLREQPETVEHDFFSAISDLMYSGIQLNDDELIQSVDRYVSGQFRRYRDNADNQPVLFPAVYYEVAYKTVRKAATSENEEIQFIGRDVASAAWFLGGTAHTYIHEATFNWMWINLRISVEFEKDDYIFAFWKNSHQYSYTGLNYIPEDRDRDNPLIILNRAEVDQRARERDKFFEFHHALGGMLLFSQRYALLRKIFSHTMSIPPRYELLPVSMTEVFNLFFKFWDPLADFYIGRYNFPGVDGIDGEQQSKRWICSYIALLLIRQYHIYSHWYGYEPVSLPQIPGNQVERHNWMHQLHFFKEMVVEIQKNESLLKTLGYKRITEEWSRENHKPTPEALIDQTLEAITRVYESAEVEDGLDPAKVDSFLTKSARIIGMRINGFDNIQNAEEITENFDAGRIAGIYSLYSKAPFTREPAIAHMNFDTFLATEQAGKITREIMGMFRSKVQRDYLFRMQELFQGVDRLNVNAQEHVLLNFNIAIDVVNDTLHDEHLTSEQYRGIPIITIQSTNQELIRSSLLVIKRRDLPRFYFLDLDAEVIEQFGLQQISEPIKLFGTVIDFNEQPNIKQLFREQTEDTLDTSVLMRLDMQMEVRWRQEMNIVRLGLYSEFFQQGIVDNLDDVQPFT